MKRRFFVLAFVLVVIFGLTVCLVTIPSGKGPAHVLELSIGDPISINSTARTYGVLVSNTLDAPVLYPAAGDRTHHPLLALEYQTNSDWKYSVDVDIGGIMLPLAPHSSLHYQVTVPAKASKFRTGIFRIALTWRGRFGFYLNHAPYKSVRVRLSDTLISLDAVRRATKEWSPEYLEASNVVAVVEKKGT